MELRFLRKKVGGEQEKAVDSKQINRKLTRTTGAPGRDLPKAPSAQRVNERFYQ